AGLVYDDANVAWASSLFRPSKSASDQGGVMTLRINAVLPVVAPADTGRVLARYRDGQVTLSRLETELSQISPMIRPSVDTPEDMRDELDAIVLEPYRARMAR